MEIFKVICIHYYKQRTYYLEGMKGRAIWGEFYSEEIQNTKYPHDYLVEMFLHRKGKIILPVQDIFEEVRAFREEAAADSFQSWREWDLNISCVLNELRNL
ncbi:hypothetical protein PR048_003530 [Dryococelus australis]|uniref:Uncharacterized protein n=1 Tax=Dryococelus australis TaxID=614101 RepID=A0ABQ9INB9_9NEOP|nr:hypothetical protein PR048_003530 [Dryococelus australis]